MSIDLTAVDEFLSCYFYQGSSSEYESWEQALYKYLHSATREEILAAERGLKWMTENYHDIEFDAQMERLGCDYSPERELGIPLKDWAYLMLAEIGRFLSGISE